MKKVPPEAQDFWRQLLERARENDWSTFQDPQYIHNWEFQRKAFRKAGWSDEEIKLQEKYYNDFIEKAPITSLGVSRDAEARLDILSKDIILGVSIIDKFDKEKIHFVVEPVAGPITSLINVIMTDQSIISMGSFFTRYCGVISKAFVRTQNIFIENNCNSISDMKFVLKHNVSIISYWWKIFISFALTGTNILVPFVPANKKEIVLVEQVAYAMEVFALSHEYAHHKYKSKSDSKFSIFDTSGNHEEEYYADDYALKVSDSIESMHLVRSSSIIDIKNPYLTTGAGAIVLLGSIEIFRKTKNKIFNASESKTHPKFINRSNRISKKYVLIPEKYNISCAFCSFSENVIKCIYDEMDAFFKSFPVDSLSDLKLEDWEANTFKPM